LELDKVKWGDFLRTKNIYDAIFEHFSKPYQEEFLGRTCSAGFDTYYIHNDGNVYKCQNDFFYNKNELYNIFENNSLFDMEHYSNHICTCKYCRHGNFNVEIF
jgi:MoaA/NifB/PqqE/SkfB family radical SAM enzyme